MQKQVLPRFYFRLENFDLTFRFGILGSVLQRFFQVMKCLIVMIGPKSRGEEKRGIFSSFWKDDLVLRTTDSLAMFISTSCKYFRALL